MKKLILLFFFLQVIDVFPQDYFPFKMGNNWTYYNTTDTTFKRTYLVKDSLQIGGNKYYVFGLQNSTIGDTIRKDEKGRILKFIKGKGEVWFDFTKEDNSNYLFAGYASFNYSVTVKKNVTVKTIKNTFTGCIQLIFNPTPQVVDADMDYTFAPDAGLIRKLGAKNHDLLYSYKTGITGIERGIGEKLPADFRLFQNYPNPFNPVTKIKYALPAAAFVQIKIFDLLGREVICLENEYKNSGNYEVEFDGKNLAGGLYFCNFNAGNFSEVKKMILLR